MRFVRNTSANIANENGKRPRNCIATATIKADKILKNNVAINFLKSFKEKIISFYNNVDKRVWAFCSTALSLTALITFFNLNFSFGYNVFLNGQDLGYALNKEFVQRSISEINIEFSEYVSGQDLIDGNIAYIPSVILKKNFTDKNQFKENIKATSFVMEKAFAVRVDGKAYVALNDEKSAHDVLDVILNSYKFSQNTETCFEEKVDVLHEYVPSSIILSMDQAIDRLLSYTTVLKSVSPSLTMTLSDFARENGLDEDIVKDLNPGIKKYVSGTDSITIPFRKPIITVISKDIITYEMPIPFEQKTTEDSSLYEGTEKILRYGKDGVSQVSEQITYINGRQGATTLLSNDIKVEPTTQMVSKGTKKRPDNMGTGSFLRPYYGQISSRFGYRRSGAHTGVDFCGSAGDPILASDNGTVIFSGWSGGYGYVVKIDHNNGYVTYYAHCSSLLVDVGETVKKGQTIATVGSTGNSTGPHVHFEIHYNDKVQNPMNFVG